MIEGNTEPPPTKAPGRIPWQHVLILCIVVAGGRAAFAADRSFFNISPDGPAAFGMARWISGTGPWHMFDVSTWRPGYSTVLAPLFWLTDDSEQLIRLALTVNAALAGISAVILAALVRRLTQVGPTAAILISAAIALSPSSLSASAHVWAESFVTLSFLCTLWYVLEYFEHVQARSGLLAILWSTIGITVHGRLLPLWATVTILVVHRAFVEQRRSVVVLAASAVTGLVLSTAYAELVIDRVWATPGDTNTLSSVVRQFRAPLAILDAAIGQIWYQLVASTMLAGVGLIVLARSARSPTRTLPTTTDARLVLLLTGPLVALSIVFTAGRERPDQWIYGRYNDAVLWPLLAIGVVWLLNADGRSGRSLTIVMGTVSIAAVELGLLVHLLHGETLSNSLGIAAMIPGVLPFTRGTHTLNVIVATFISIGMFVAFVLIRTKRGVRATVPMALCGVVIVAGGALTHNVLQRRLNGGSDSAAAVLEIEQIVPIDEVLGVRFVPDEFGPSVPASQQLSYALYYEWALPSYSFRADFGADNVGPYVFAPDNDPLFVAAGSEVLWRDPYSGMVLWFES